MKQQKNLLTYAYGIMTLFFLFLVSICFFIHIINLINMQKHSMMLEYIHFIRKKLLENIKIG